MCFWSRIGKRHKGFCLMPPNEVDVAEVLEVGHVGGDKTGGKRTKGTFNNDMASEMEMSEDEHVTQTPFHLEPMRCCMNCAL